MVFLPPETHEKLLSIATYLKDWICKILEDERIHYVFGSTDFSSTQEITSDNSYLIEWYKERGEPILCDILSKLTRDKEYDENVTEAVHDINRKLDYLIYINDIELPINHRFATEYLVVFCEYIDFLDSFF